MAEPALILSGLLNRALLLRDEEGWVAFRPGVDVRSLYQTEGGGPSAALLRYQPGAAMPWHEHLGYEHILVLQGSQSDEHGLYPTGTLVVNRPGSSHRVVSEEGCVVLIVWERGVRFADASVETTPPGVPALEGEDRRVEAAIKKAVSG